MQVDYNSESFITRTSVTSEYGSRLEKPRTSNLESQWKLVPSILVGIYFSYLWESPIFPSLDLRWYMVLGIAGFAFLIQKRRLNMQAAKVFWGVYGLGLLGAIVSLTRAASLEIALWNTVGSSITFVTILLLLPVLAVRQSRKLLMVILLGTALLWSIEIQQLVGEFGTLRYSTFSETGSNKNHIGILLSLSAVASLYFAVFPNNPNTLHKWQELLVRAFLFTLCAWLFYNLSLIYARSSLLIGFIGILVILGKMLMESKGLVGIYRVFLVAGGIALIVTFMVPIVQTLSPSWGYLLDNLTTGTSSNRIFLLRKGWFLISENPFVGTGIGGSRDAVTEYYASFPDLLIHNSYLTEWAEKGLLGLLGNIVWILAYLRLMRDRFYSLNTVDQTWLLLLMLFFIEMNFINMGLISIMFLAIFSAIYYERVDANTTEKS